MTIGYTKNSVFQSYLLYFHYFLKIFICVMGLVLLNSCASSTKINKSKINKRTVVTTAINQVGKPYKLSGESPQEGFDCSGLVLYSFAQSGVMLPRTSNEQYRFTKRVKKPDNGDLVFFGKQANKITHVGIYLGDNKMVHAPGYGRNVEITSLNYPYWQKNYIGAGRM